MIKLVVTISFLFIFSYSSLMANEPLPTVEKVEIEAYVGKWYEVSRLPNRFQRKCLKSTADYGLLNESSISLVNTCYKKNGKISTIKGVATITNIPSNSKLLIKFKTWYSWLIPKGKYWILSLEKNQDSYEFSLVGTPDRKFLWILSRSPNPSLSMVMDLKAKAKALGFATEKMIDNF